VASRVRKSKYSKLGANLRSLGLLPKGYNLSDNAKHLSKNQRDRIVKLARKYPGPAHRPEDFVAKRVTKSTARKLRDSDYRVKFSHAKSKGPLAIFERHGAAKVSLRKGRVVREYEGGGKRQTLLGKNLVEQAKVFFARKREGEFLMLRVGDKHEFGRRFYSLAAFEGYLKWLRDKGEDYDFPWDQLYILSHEGPHIPLPQKKGRRRAKPQKGK
jgi:mRNA-degrading endonuclease RelE of RelBE toxin-antitoxin system